MTPIILSVLLGYSLYGRSISTVLLFFRLFNISLYTWFVIANENSYIESLLKELLKFKLLLESI